MEKTGATRDTEITLGTGKLLGIFFVMVIICAAFFTMGYLLGRGSTSMAASTTIVSSVPTNGGNPANKPSAGGNMVQVAAVSKQEDADILVNALRKKQYPVFVANLPSDPLFHVQVGPFSDPKEAEAMRSRLAGDGYNAIVKK